MAAIVVVTFSEFNVLFKRLEDTHFAGFELDTRAGIFDAFSKRFANKADAWNRAACGNTGYRQVRVVMSHWVSIRIACICFSCLRLAS